MLGREIPCGFSLNMRITTELKITYYFKILLCDNHSFSLFSIGFCVTSCHNKTALRKRELFLFISKCVKLQLKSHNPHLNDFKMVFSNNRASNYCKIYLQVLFSMLISNYSQLCLIQISINQITFLFVGVFKSSFLYFLLFLAPHKSNFLEVKAFSSVLMDSL